MRKRIPPVLPLALALALIALLLTGCTDRVPDIGNDEESSTTEEAAEPSEPQSSPVPAKAQSLVATWGETLDYEGLRVSVDPLSTVEGAEAAAEGRRIVETTVEVTNTTQDEIRCSAKSFVLQCDDALVYNPTADGADSALLSCTLEPGEAATGKLRFEIPGPSEPARVAYYPESGEGSFMAWHRP